MVPGRWASSAMSELFQRTERPLFSRRPPVRGEVGGGPEEGEPRVGRLPPCPAAADLLYLVPSSHPLGLQVPSFN